MLRVITRQIKTLALAAAGQVTIPAGWAIDRIYYRNTTANAVTGGIKFGTTAGGVDVVAALAVAGSAIGSNTDALTLKRYFSKTVDQTIFMDAVTGWNSAVVDIHINIHQVDIDR